MFLINKIWLIDKTDYSFVKLLEKQLKKQNILILNNRFFKLKYKGYLTEKLKVIKSRNNIFCY